MIPSRRAAALAALVALACLTGLAGPPVAPATAAPALRPLPFALGIAGPAGPGSTGPTTPVIVTLRDVPAPVPDQRADRERRRAVVDRADRLVGRLPAGSVHGVTRFDTTPAVALEVDAVGLEALRSDPGVAAVAPNGRKRLALSQATPKVGAPSMWGAGATGAGQTVAILDTGVQSSHPFLAGKVVSEACYSSSFFGSTAVCPGGDPTTSTAPGAGLPCPVLPDCNHGTHVAGIAAGGSGGSFSGVAPGASIIAVQVFSKYDAPADCLPYPAPCTIAWDSDIIRGLDRVYALRGAFDIAAVNLSLGGGAYAGACDSDPEKPAIDQLRGAGIVTVVASGNDAGSVGKNTLAAPACVSSVVSVGATDDITDAVPGWVQTAPNLTLFAPGQLITSSVAPGGGGFACPAPFAAGQCASWSGTSMATPMVTGAMALLRQYRPGISVFEAIALLRDTGVPVTDTATAPGVTAPRLALQAVVQPPSFHPVTPTRILDTRSGPGVGPGGTVTVTATGVAGIPAKGVSAVAVNLTAVGPSAATFVTAYATGSPRPLVSNLNVAGGETRANSAVVRLSGDGRFELFNNSGGVHLLADVVGWFDLGGTAATGARYTPRNPTRILDTRSGVGAPAAKVGPVQTIDVAAAAQCSGTGTVRAVVVNLTAVAGSAATHLTSWAAGTAMPTVSNLNAPSGAVVPNLAVVPVSATGQISIYNNSGTIDVLADLEGCFRDGTGATGSFVPADPRRFLDTRAGWGAPLGPLGPGASLDLPVAGTGGVPPTGVAAVLLNVTATGPTAPTHLTVWPTGQPRPTVSNLNVVAGQTAPNLVVVAVGAGGKVSIFNNSGSTDVIADVFGFAPA